MFKILFVFVSLLFALSCTKSPAEEEKPLFDFLAGISNYRTPAYIRSHKNSIPCSETPYWEGKKMKLQGYVLQLNIDTVQKSFFLYESYNVAVAETWIIKYEMANHSILSKMLADNKDKHCILTASCRTSSCIPGFNTKSIDFVITRLEDLEFK